MRRAYMRAAAILVICGLSGLPSTASGDQQDAAKTSKQEQAGFESITLCSKKTSECPKIKASDVVAAIGDSLPGITLKALNDKVIVIGWRTTRRQQDIEKEVKDCKELIHQIVADYEEPPPARPASEGHVLQLANNRDAAGFATALADTIKDVKPLPLGNDVVIIPSVDDDAKALEVKRVAALADLSRAQVDLHLVSVQVSANDSKTTSQAAEKIGELVNLHNHQLEAALDQAWFALADDASSGFNPQFSDYVRDEFAVDAAGDHAACVEHNEAGDAKFPWNVFPKARYCLGYHDAFDLNNRSLSKLIFLLVASRSPLATANKVIEAMAGSNEQEVSLADCDQWDSNLLKPEQKQGQQKTKAAAQQQSSPALPTGAVGPQFACFHRQLRESLRPRQLSTLRIAFADFLFQYKSAVEYPHSFVPYDLLRSRDQLDAQLEPLVTAFNRDVRAYLGHLEQQVAAMSGGNASFASTGIITVRSTSGKLAKSTVDTANTFESPSSPTVNDLASSLLDAEKNIPALAKGNLSSHAAAGLVAGLNISRERLVRLGRSLDVSVTPTAVLDGSGADLEVSLTAVDSPQDTSSFNSIIDDKSKADDTDRVSKHSVDTTIRVPVSRIFDISTFSAALARRKTSIPLLPPFLEVPYVGNFLRLPLGTSKAYHSSIVVGAAIVAPTAFDVAHSIAFNGDRIRDESERSTHRASDADHVLSYSRPYHKALMACWSEDLLKSSQAFKRDVQADHGNDEPTKADECKVNFQSYMMEH